jgi:hypothetical protein
MTAVECHSGTEDIIEKSWLNIQHDGPAAFKLSEKSSATANLTGKKLPTGLTEVLTVH